jgi:hypothetical protein
LIYFAQISSNFSCFRLYFDGMDWHAFCIYSSNTKFEFGNTKEGSQMQKPENKDKSTSQLFKQFLLELISVRAGFYVKQDPHHPETLRK